MRTDVIASCIALLLAIAFVPHSKAMAQQAEFEENFPITGHYSGEGFDITLPEGWRARTNPDSDSSILAVYLLEGWGAENPSSMIMAGISYVPFSQHNWAWFEAPAYQEGCDVVSASYRLMQDKLAKVLEVECDEPIDYMTNARATLIYQFYAKATDGDKLYAGVFLAPTIEALDMLMDDIEQMMTTFTFDGAADISSATAEFYGGQAVEETVTANDHEVSMRVESMCSIDSITFNEELKFLRFNAGDENPDCFLTTIPIGRVLEGPYQVSIDGEMMDSPAYYTIEDEETGQISMVIQHGPGQEVEIVGTQVVPEFPFAILLAASAIGTIAVVTRLKRMEFRRN